MPRYSKKRSKSRAKRGVKKSSKYRTSYKRRKARRTYKAPGIPRSIVPADYQQRSVAVNFEYVQQWAVSPRIIGATGGNANRLQFMAFAMNNPTDIFSAGLPFGDSSTYTQSAIPNYAAAQLPYGVAVGGVVLRSHVNSFPTWGKRYKQACVIGSEVTCVLRPKAGYIDTHTPAFDTGIPAGAQGTQQSYPGYTGAIAPQFDASKIVSFLTDSAPFHPTDGESINANTPVTNLVQRAGVRLQRMSYTAGGKDGALVKVKYSPKKFFDIKDLKDNQQHWVSLDPSTNMFGAVSKPVWGIIGIQKEETQSPTGVEEFQLKPQHNYHVEVKASYTVLLRDPVIDAAANVPQAGQGTGPSIPVHDEL